MCSAFMLCISACCILLDSAGSVVGSKAIIVTKRNGKTVVSKSERHVLQYGDPQSLTAETVATIGRRWQPNTLSFVLERESTHYAWYDPSSHSPARRRIMPRTLNATYLCLPFVPFASLVGCSLPQASAG